MGTVIAMILTLNSEYNWVEMSVANDFPLFFVIVS